ncbi:MAG: terminase large subunit, partial [Burkholderiales bacterium]|nr:terminase large subunit [Burkholderiales bacterium]
MRRFRVALMLVPRKNAKSTLASTVVAYMLTADGESGAECYSAATTRDQAKVVAEIVWEMAKRSPAFRDYFGVRLGAKTTRVLEVPATASKFAPLSADAHTLDALNVSLAVVDELHAHPTRGVWDVLDTATGARLQPLMLATTTAGVDIGGICYEKREYLHKVLEGVLEDEAFFGVEYTLDEGDDWREETSWRKANPNFGVSVNPEDLARKVRAAEHTPSEIANVLTKHFNIWVKSATSWMPMDQWHACADSTLSLETLRPHPCWIGVDLAEVRDIAAVVALFKLPNDRFAAIGRFYLPEDTVQASPIAQYSGWVRSGHLLATSGGATDYGRIEDDIKAWVEILRVQEVAFDRALAAQMGQQLAARLGAVPPVITVNQNVETMNPAMQWLEKLVVERRFSHPADPVLTWQASNVVVERNHKGEIYPRKAGGKDSH